MVIRKQIESMFGNKAFERSLFYAYEGGLRFELSEGGSYIDKFLTAHKKASEICDVVFSELENIAVCIKFYGGEHLFESLSIFRELRELNITFSQSREYWSELNEDGYSHYVVGRTPLLVPVGLRVTPFD